MAKINWPPKKSFKYTFIEEKELNFEIPFEENSIEKNDKLQEENNNR